MSITGTYLTCASFVSTLRCASLTDVEFFQYDPAMATEITSEYYRCAHAAKVPFVRGSSLWWRLQLRAFLKIGSHELHQESKSTILPCDHSREFDGKRGKAILALHLRPAASRKVSRHWPTCGQPVEFTHPATGCVSYGPLWLGSC
jgi:hypothetical protein